MPAAAAIDAAEALAPPPLSGLSRSGTSGARRDPGASRLFGGRVDVIVLSVAEGVHIPTDALIPRRDSQALLLGAPHLEHPLATARSHDVDDVERVHPDRTGLRADSIREVVILAAVLGLREPTLEILAPHLGGDLLAVGEGDNAGGFGHAARP